MGTLGTQRCVVAMAGIDDRRVRIDIEHPAGDVAEERVEFRRFCRPPDATREQAVTGEQVNGIAGRGPTERQRDRTGGE